MSNLFGGGGSVQPIIIPTTSPMAGNPPPATPPPPPAFGQSPSVGPGMGAPGGGAGQAFNASVLGTLPAPGQQAQRTLLGT